MTTTGPSPDPARFAAGPRLGASIVRAVLPAYAMPAVSAYASAVLLGDDELARASTTTIAVPGALAALAVTVLLHRRTARTPRQRVWHPLRSALTAAVLVGGAAGGISALLVALGAFDDTLLRYGPSAAALGAAVAVGVWATARRRTWAAAGRPVRGTRRSRRAARRAGRRRGTGAAASAPPRGGPPLRPSPPDRTPTHLPRNGTPVILVLGSTGTIGSAVLQRLSDLGVPTRALVRPRTAATPGGPPPGVPATPPGGPARIAGRVTGRVGRVVGRVTGRPGGPPSGPPATHRPAPVALPGVEHLVGDAADPQAVRRALVGVDQVFLLIGNGPAQERIELGVVREAAAAGVTHVVKVSAPVVGDDVPVAIARMHGRIEAAITASGMTGTFLRPYAFFQNLLANADMIRHTGTFVGATDVAMNMVDARDVADVAVVALTRPGARGRAHVLTGAGTVSYPEVAAHLTRLGAPTRFVPIPPAELAAGLTARGLPSWLVEHVVEIQQMTRTHPERPTRTVADLTGRAPRTLHAFLREHLPAFAPVPGAPSHRPDLADAR